MKKLLFYLLFFSIVCLLPAQEISLSSGAEESALTLLQEDLSNPNNAYMEFQCHSKSFFAESVESSHGKFTKISIPGFACTNVAGKPELPIATQLIEIPAGANVSVEILSRQVLEFSLARLQILHPIFPFQPSSDRFVKNQEDYTADYNMAEPVSLTEVGILRNSRIFHLKIHLANYSPRQGKIKFYNDVRVRIHISGYNLTSARIAKQKYASAPFTVALQNVVQSQAISPVNSNKSPIEYIIIADPIFKNILPSFCTHKISKGYRVALHYTDEIGNTREQIKAYIQKEYDQPEDGIAPTFLILVGDYNQIPTYPGVYGKQTTDLYYATLRGNDILPDVLYGRYHASSPEELSLQINQSMAYERGELDPFESSLTLIYHGSDSIGRLSQNLGILQNRSWQSRAAWEASNLLGDPGLKNYWRDSLSVLSQRESRGTAFIKSNDYCRFARPDGEYAISGEWQLDFYGIWGGYVTKEIGRPTRVLVSLGNFSPVDITYKSGTLQDGSQWSVVQKCSMLWQIKAKGCSSNSRYSLKGEGQSIAVMKRISFSYVVAESPDKILVLKPETDPESFTIYGGIVSMHHNFKFHLEVRVDYKFYFDGARVEWKDTLNMSQTVYTEDIALWGKLCNLAYANESLLYWASPCYKIRIVPSSN